MRAKVWQRYLLIIAGTCGLTIGASGSARAAAQETVMNLYTARHYATDEAFYTGFSKLTGIKLNRIEGGEDALFERIKAEGAASPADVFLTVDVARLWRAEQAGIFAPLKSELLAKRIPAHFRDPNGNWFGYSSRARVIAYDRARVSPGDIARYENLADGKWQKELCTRPSSHPYNLSLISSMILHLGMDKARSWAQGVTKNLARPPRGGDTDQLKAVEVGECAIALANHYYYLRLVRSAKAEDQALVKKVGILWPNQNDRGAHLNISGGGMLKNAPHRQAAVKFLEYLAGDSAQALFANGNNEWPTVAGVKLANPDLEKFGQLRTDNLPLTDLGKTQGAAQKLADQVGWK